MLHYLVHTDVDRCARLCRMYATCIISMTCKYCGYSCYRSIPSWHLFKNRWPSTAARSNDNRVPRLLRHNVPAVRNLRLHSIRLRWHSTGVSHKRSYRISITGTANSLAFFKARVLSKPWQLEDRLVPSAPPTENLGPRCQGDEGPNEYRNCGPFVRDKSSIG